MSSSQHKLLVLLAGTVAVAAGLTGCAGNGDGLNSIGQPASSGSGSGTVPLTADFQSIQDNVFTPICSPCHSGASAPEGLMLDAAHSYSLLVGVPSQEVPTLDRVKPGDPTNSYLIIKLTNGPGIVGQQMPRGEPPLPQATIDVIEQWITNGALQGTTSTASSVNAMQKLQELGTTPTPPPFSVTFTSPVNEAVVDEPVTHVVVVFNQEVDATLINYTTLSVARVDPATSMDNAEQTVTIPSYASLAEGNPNTIVITPVAPLLPGTYQVTVRGSGGGALADLNAQALGSDYSFTFTVDGSP
jgi:hypothetical protein